jgi:spermidine/putrescine-binding protein
MLFNEAIFKGGVKNKGYMKNSIRDAYASSAIMSNKEELSSLSNGFTDYNETYQAKLKEIINDTSSTNMDKVEKTLRKQKDYLFAYESDDGKVEMLKSKPDGWYGLFWSCDAGYAMEGYEELLEGSAENVEDSVKYATSLFYGVPVEGSNVWVDSFVIPKYTKNEKGAQYFLKYLCEYDNAYLNRDYAGCSSPVKAVAEDIEEVMRTALKLVKGEEVEVSEDIAEDVEYYQEFFSTSNFSDFGDMFIEMLFPTEEILSRCAVMKDSDKDACIEMAKMWIRVKAS